MLYSKEIIIPANTTKDNPFSANLPVVNGIVKRVWVRWRWGSANLCGCKILRGAFQLWPTALGQWFPSTTFDTTFEERYTVDAEPMHFMVMGYNLDDTFPHTLWVATLVLREDGLGWGLTEAGMPGWGVV